VARVMMADIQRMIKVVAGSGVVLSCTQWTQGNLSSRPGCCPVQASVHKYAVAKSRCCVC